MKSVTLSLLQSAANAFDFGGPVVCDAHHYGEGHINDTFVVWREDHSKRFILQRINTDTFIIRYTALFFNVDFGCFSRISTLAIIVSALKFVRRSCSTVAYKAHLLPYVATYPLFRA